MSQLNNNAEENTTANIKNDNDVKSKASKKEKKIKKKHPTRNMIIFMILFTVVCVGVTIFFILKSHGAKDITEIKNIVEEVLKPDDGKVVPDGLGIASLNETYKENPIKITKVDVKKRKDSYGQTIEYSYPQIDGLANEEIEQKINDKIKEDYMLVYESAKKGSIDAECYANFGNVVSFYIRTYSEDGPPILEGYNFDLSTGEEIPFKDLFTNTAPIKNILSSGISDSLKEYAADGTMEDELADSSDADNPYEGTEEKKRREEEFSKIESISFKMLNYYNNGGEFNYYFSPRKIYIAWEDECIEIPMCKYYEHIAIYNRYKNNTDIYDGQYNNQDVLENNAIPVFCSSNDINIPVDYDSGDPIYVDYLNVTKVSDNLIVAVVNETGSNNAIKDNVEEFKAAQRIVKEYIDAYKNKSDGKTRFVQIRMNFVYEYKDDYSISKDKLMLDPDISEYIVSNKDKEKFFEKVLRCYQNGSSSIYWDEYEKKNVGIDYEYNYMSCYDDNSDHYKYNKSTKKWEKINETQEPSEPESPAEPEEPIAPEEPANPTASNGNVIVIDPGHQTKANTAKEPIGPGASETKMKVTGGATGVATGKTEYQLNLEVSLKLKAALEQKGYTVIMTRTTNDVDMSNSERAQIANNANAAAFIRIHANSVDSSSVKGVLTMCQTANNPYNGNLASQSYSLSKAVLDGFVSETGANNKGVTRTDEMSGINWCTVPTTIVEMGFMSNPEEDRLMSTDDYQNKMVKGIVKGIDQFLGK